MTNPFFPGLGEIVRPTGGLYDDTLSDIAPFTRRNTATFLTKFEDFVAWMGATADTLSENDKKLRLAWIAQAEDLIASWTQQSADLIAAVVNNSVTIQDPVVAALFGDTDSDAYQAVNALLHDMIKEDPDDEGTFLINPTPTINPDGLQPDPNDEGFFV